MTCSYYWLLTGAGTRVRSLGKFNTAEQVERYVRLHRVAEPYTVTFAATRAGAIHQVRDNEERSSFSPRPGARREERR